MNPKLPNSLFKRQFLSFLSFGIFIIVLQLGFIFYKNHSKVEFPEVQFSEQKLEKTPLILSEFNPNDLDEKQWKNLGFSEKQIATILKYKSIIGGKFLSKEQFKKCYPIVDRYQELEPYILLPETNAEAKSPNFDFKKYEKKELKIPGKFNPDTFSANDFVAMGFTENQANAILKYKNYLGGSFISKEKFKQCFIISAENYRKMAPFLLLPETTPERTFAKNSSYEKPKIAYKNFDPNVLDLQGWQSLGFSEKQAQVIVNYRDRNLKGSFKNLEDIQKCFVISEEKFNEMKPFIHLNPETMKVTASQNSFTSIQKNETSPEIKTDFSKIDLNQISYKQLLEFGFDGKAAGSFVGFRNKLGGFVTEQQILETYDIDKELAQKLINTAKLNTSSVKKYTLADAPEEWLKNHPYFKYSADKIIFYRVMNPDDKKIWKFIKVKPEYEAKMRLYLK